MMGHDSFAGWFTVAVKEARATIQSPRFIIIALILALAVLAGTYAILPGAGIAASGEIAYGFTYWPALNRSNPELAMFVTSPSGQPLSGVDVSLAAQRDSQTTFLESRPTSDGWARFGNLSTRYPDSELLLFLANDPSHLRASAVTSSNWSNVPREYVGILDARFTPLGLTNRQVVSLVFIDSKGVPVVGADVYIWKPNQPVGPDLSNVTPPGGWDLYRNGTTGPNGYYISPEPLTVGIYFVHTAAGNLNDSALISFSADPDPLSRGPDGVLAYAGVTFLPFLLPIVAMVLGYDAIARERAEGSLDLLLSKPVGRMGVAIGKLIGAFGSGTLPVAIVLVGSALLIWLQSGLAPSATFLGVFLLISFFALFVYTAVFLAVSALVKNSGTALLVSVLLLLTFTFFWGLVSLVISGFLSSPGSPRWFELRVLSSLFSPTGVYQQWLTLSAPALAGGFYGPIGGTAALLPGSLIALAASVWTAGPLALFLWTVKYRISES